MGDRLTEEEKSKQTSPTPYGDTFDELLPQYMAMGMTYDEFWDGEYGTKRACRKAYRIRMENEQRLADRNNWYMGQYIMSALAASALRVAGLNTKGGMPDYVSKPFLERYEEQQKEEAVKRKQEDQQKLAMAMFQAMATQFNRNKEQKSVGTGQ